MAALKQALNHAQQGERDGGGGHPQQRCDGQGQDRGEDDGRRRYGSSHSGGRAQCHGQHGDHVRSGRSRGVQRGDRLDRRSRHRRDQQHGYQSTDAAELRRREQADGAQAEQVRHACRERHRYGQQQAVRDNTGAAVRVSRARRRWSARYSSPHRSCLPRVESTECRRPVPEATCARRPGPWPPVPQRT